MEQVKSTGKLIAEGTVSGVVAAAAGYLTFDALRPGGFIPDASFNIAILTGFMGLVAAGLSAFYFTLAASPLSEKLHIRNYRHSSNRRGQ